MRGGPTDQPLWTNARVIFEVRSPGLRSSRIITLRRPHALIGSIVRADIPLANTSISARHAYVHVDDRGVCLIDLASRTGTRLNGEPMEVAWLRLGDVVEIGGREIELREVHLNGFPFSPPNCNDQPLADADERMRVSLALEPIRARGTSYVIGSELLFIGQGESCGIQLTEGSAVKTHCALVRGSSAAYIIDLFVDRTSVNHQSVRRSARLQDGDLLTLGQSQFVVHMEAISGEVPKVTDSLNPSPSKTDSRSDHVHALMRVVGSVPTPSNGQTHPLETVPIESQPPVVAWMLNALQASHGELLRRQNELQDALGQVLKQVNDDSSSALDAHQERIEALTREVEELRRKVEAEPPVAIPPTTVQPTITFPPPSVSPLKTGTTPPPLAIGTEESVAETAAVPCPPPTEFVGPPAPVSDRSRETTSWLLHQIDKVETQNQFSFWSLFGRGRRRPPNSPLSQVDGVDHGDFDPKNGGTEKGSKGLSDGLDS